MHFNKNDRKRIYRNYFSIDNKRNNIKIKFFNTLNNEKINIRKKEHFNIIKNMYNSYKRLSIIHKETISNSIIKGQNNIIFEINKYKRKINELKKIISIKNSKIKEKKDENNKLKIFIENKMDCNKKNILKIRELIKILNTRNYKENNNDLLNLINEIKEEFNEKRLINGIINLIKNIYIENNYSFSSNESRKVINLEEISYNLLWDWIRNIPKVLFYEKIKNNLENKKNNINDYELFIQNFFYFFGVHTFEDLTKFFQKLIN